MGLGEHCIKFLCFMLIGLYLRSIKILRRVMDFAAEILFYNNKLVVLIIVSTINITINYAALGFVSLTSLGLVFFNNIFETKHKSRSFTIIPIYIYINILCLSVCLYLTDKRQNGYTDRAIFLWDLTCP